MPRRIDAGEVVAALGGVLVFVSLFLDWFDGVSGWQSFETLDLLLALLAAFAVWTAVASTLALRSAPSPGSLPLLGIAIVLIVLVQLIEPPPSVQIYKFEEAAGGGAALANLDPDRDVGAWLALAGGALVLLGGALRLARISVTISVGGRDVRRRVPAVDRRPASPAAPAPPPDPEPGPDPQATQSFSPLPEDR